MLNEESKTFDIHFANDDSSLNDDLNGVDLMLVFVFPQTDSQSPTVR